MVATAGGSEQYDHNFKSLYSKERHCVTSKWPPECCKQSGHKAPYFF